MTAIGVLRNRLRSNYPFTLAYRLRWADNDQYGHLNNSVYNFLWVYCAPLRLGPSPNSSPASTLW